jgi:hypothetical protein
MSPIIVALSVFAVAIVVMAIYARNSTLEKLEAFPGEETLFEEEGIDVHQDGGQQPTRFINCMVRVTNKRLIVAQKPVLGKSKALRHIAVFEPREPVESLPHATMSGAFITVTLDKDSIVCKPNASPIHVAFPLDGMLLTTGQTVLISTKNIDEFKKHFRVEE